MKDRNHVHVCLNANRRNRDAAARVRRVASSTSSRRESGSGALSARFGTLIAPDGDDLRPDSAATASAPDEARGT